MKSSLVEVCEDVDSSAWGGKGVKSVNRERTICALTPHLFYVAASLRLGIQRLWAPSLTLTESDNLSTASL